MMVAVTYGVTRAAKFARKAAAKATQQKGVFARFVDALVETRMQQAHREIVRHAHLMPRNAKDSPFGGW
jgi:hypothetical protein